MPAWYDWAGPMYAGMAGARGSFEDLLSARSRRELEQVNTLAKMQELFRPKMPNIDDLLKQQYFNYAMDASQGDPQRLAMEYGRLSRLGGGVSPEEMGQQMLWGQPNYATALRGYSEAAKPQDPTANLLKLLQLSEQITDVPPVFAPQGILDYLGSPGKTWDLLMGNVKFPRTQQERIQRQMELFPGYGQPIPGDPGLMFGQAEQYLRQRAAQRGTPYGR